MVLARLNAVSLPAPNSWYDLGLADIIVTPYKIEKLLQPTNCSANYCKYYCHICQYILFATARYPKLLPQFSMCCVHCER